LHLKVIAYLFESFGFNVFFPISNDSNSSFNQGFLYFNLGIFFASILCSIYFSHRLCLLCAENLSIALSQRNCLSLCLWQQCNCFFRAPNYFMYFLYFINHVTLGDLSSIRLRFYLHYQTWRSGALIACSF